MRSLEKNAFGDIDNELTLIGERVRDIALEQVAYLAEREMLPEIKVGLGKEPREMLAGTTDGYVPMGWSDAERYARIDALSLREEGVVNLLGSALILSMGGLYRCVTFPVPSSGRYGEAENRHIPHWSTRNPVGPQAWIENRHIISHKLAQAEEEAYHQRHHRAASIIEHSDKYL